MAWLNLFKAESDVAIGYQSINQAKDNLEYLRDSMLAKHAAGIRPSSAIGVGAGGFKGGTLLQPPWQISPLKTLGRHNDHRIPRAVAYVSFGTLYNSTTPYAYLSWASDQFSGIVRFGTGSFFLPVSGLSLYWATVTVYATSNTPKRFGQVRPYYPPTGNPGTPGVFVQTYDLSAGVFSLTDSVPFSVALYGKAA